METFTWRVSQDVHKVEVNVFFIYFLSTNRPHEHLVTFLVCTESSDEPLSKICCTCASFGWDLVALLGECKSSVISHKKLIPLQMFVLGKHQHDCITDKYDFRVNSSYLTSLDRREALITPNKCHGTFRIAWKARPGIFFFQERCEWFWRRTTRHGKDNRWQDMRRRFIVGSMSCRGIPWQTVLDCDMSLWCTGRNRKKRVIWCCFGESPSSHGSLSFPHPLWSSSDRQTEETWPETNGCLIISIPLSFCH